MAKGTRKFVIPSAIAGVALLWWWSAARGGGDATRGGAEASGEPTRVAMPALDEAALRRLDPRALEKAAISGQVREPDGRAIAGATVCAGSDAAGLDRKELDARRCVTSEADGRYRIDGLLPVPQFVHASAPQHVPGEYREGEGPRARSLVRVRVGQETGGIDVVLRPGGVEVEGVVRDLSGGELEGALVSAGFAHATSGVDGKFSLWVAPGGVAIEARADGYAPGWTRGVAPGQRFELALTPESVLIGQVVRADDGAPLADADVWAMQPFASAGPGRTDAEGKFRIDGLKPGTYRLEAFHDEAYGVGPESAVLGLGETSESIVIRAHPAYLVEGTVVTAGGGSCERGWVRLRDSAVGSRAAQIEADGLARIRGLLPGTYEPQVECASYVAQASYPPVTVSDAPVRGLRWEVSPGQAIRGRVLLSEGTGVAGVHVSAEPQLDPSAPRAQTSRPWSEPSAADGTFSVVGLLPGRYRVSLYADGYPRPEAPAEVEVREGEDVEGVVLTLPATGQLRGKVEDSEGLAVRNVEVVLRGERQDAPKTRTLDDGSFHLEHVPPGAYRVQAVDASGPLQAPETGDEDVQGESVTIAAAEEREVRLVVKSQRGKIAGRVVDSAGGPLADAFVEATRERDGLAARAGDALRDARWTSFGGPETHKLTDQDGRFELRGLGDGNYTLVAQRRGGGEGVVEHVASGSEVEIWIAEAGAIAGTVRVKGGGAPQQFTVSLYEPRTGWSSKDRFFRTGGAFRFPEVPGGDYNVMVEASEGSSLAKTSVPEGGLGEVQVELLPLVTVRGRVVDALSGAPVPGMEVRMFARGQVFSFSSFDALPPGQTSDAEGRFEVERVTAGPVRAIVEPKEFGENGHARATIAVEVPTTGVTSVELPPLRVVKRRREAAGELGLEVQRPGPETEPAEARIVVASLRPGGPAIRAGLQVGDEIVSVDGQDVTGANGYLFYQLSAVPAGTKVRLGLARGATIEVAAAK